MKKITKSLLMITAVAALAIGGTVAYFSDTETSIGNIFTAGDIDLKISNQSYVSDQTTGALVASPNTSWTSTDLTDVHKFFNFTDLKPGDLGEDTIDLSVTSNDAWACAEIKITKNDDVTSTEPELTAGDTANTDSLFDGELAQNLNFVWWADDGDNVLEVDEAAGVNAGSGVMGSLDFLANAETTEHLGLPNDNKILLTLSDSQSNFFNPGVIAPLTGANTYYIGKAFCFGTLALAPVATGAGVNPITNPGVTCDGAPVTNMSQTDSLMADLTFTAVQSRNNMQYLCPEHSAVPTTSLRLENETEVAGAPWIVHSADEIYADLTWTDNAPTFAFNLTGKGLANDTSYSLIYYADGWPGNNPGAFIGSATTDGTGNIAMSGNPDLLTDMPNTLDANYSAGAKIWLVRSSDYDSSTKSMTAWNPSQYLFEGNVYIHYNDTDL